MIKTGWYEWFQEPKRRGLYEIEKSLGGTTAFQYWDGKYWGGISYSAETAYEIRRVESIYQSSRWRGLTEKPS